MTTLAEAMRWAEANTGLPHLCTDYELCPVCLLCTGCCKGHDDDAAD
jgi:hypothetical protein